MTVGTYTHTFMFMMLTDVRMLIRLIEAKQSQLTHQLL